MTNENIKISEIFKNIEDILTILWENNGKGVYLIILITKE
jgi:hypothetical protein